MERKLLVLVLIASMPLSLFSQSVAISNDGAAPNNSAMLDVRNPNKGMLIPRVALTGTTDVTTITSPAVSLLVFNTTTTGTDNTSVSRGYYYWSGAAWLRLSTDPNPKTQSWITNGNSGIDPRNDFVGTLDTVPLLFRVNNTRVGYLGVPIKEGNVFWGYGSGINAKGFSNVGIGPDALQSNTSSSNLVAIGDSSLATNSTGFQNTALGSKALFRNTQGFLNTATGYHALQSNTSGSWNTANGNDALQSNSLGSYNTAYGNGSLSLNKTGDQNTAIGHLALLLNVSGSRNIAVGETALFTNLTGTNNTALGFGADVGSGNLTNATAIGNGAITNASNKIRLGNTSVEILEGQVAYSFPSDARFKYGIKRNVPGLDFIIALTPVTYYFDGDKLAEYNKTGLIQENRAHVSYKTEKKLHTGFLAQDVEKVAESLGYDFDGLHAPSNNKDHYSLAYSQFIMPLVKAVQEQQQIIQVQADQIKAINHKMELLEAKVDEWIKR